MTYLHDVAGGEARALRAQLGQGLLQELCAAQGPPRGGTGLQGPAELGGDHLQGPHLLPLGHVLEGRHTEGGASVWLLFLHKNDIFLFLCSVALQISTFSVCFGQRDMETRD